MAVLLEEPLNFLNNSRISFDDNFFPDDFNKLSQFDDCHTMEDFLCMKEYLIKRIQDESEFVNNILYCCEGFAPENSKNKGFSNFNHSEYQLEKTNAELRAVLTFRLTQTDQMSLELNNIAEKTKNVKQSIDYWRQKAQLLESQLDAAYAIPKPKKKVSCNDELIKINEKLDIVCQEHRDLQAYEQKLTETQEKLNSALRIEKINLKLLQDETIQEIAYRKFVIASLQHALINLTRLLESMTIEKTKLNNDIAQLKIFFKEESEKVNVDINSLQTTLNSEKKDHSFIISCYQEKLADIKKLEAKLAAAAAQKSSTYFMRCQTLESDLSNLKTAHERQNKKLKNLNSIADEITSQINDIIRKRHTLIKIGDDDDKAAKKSFKRIRYNSTSSLNMSERLSFDTHHIPRDSLPFRPDQTTHYDSFSGSFCNSPRSSRQRPSSVSTQFSSVLRGCMSPFSRSNSVSNIPN